MRIYLDACCLLRPLDDQAQHRIRVESEAVCVILELCGKGLHRWISSETVENEVLRDPDPDPGALSAGPRGLPLPRQGGFPLIGEDGCNGQDRHEVESK